VSFIRTRVYSDTSSAFLHGGYTKALKEFSRMTRSYIMKTVWRMIKEQLALSADKIVVEAPLYHQKLETVHNFCVKRGFQAHSEDEEHRYYVLSV
jgi:hypothetical protein